MSRHLQNAVADPDDQRFLGGRALAIVPNNQQPDLTRQTEVLGVR